MATSVGIDVPGDPANGMPSNFTSACILKSSITYPKITARRYLNRRVSSSQLSLLPVLDSPRAQDGCSLPLTKSPMTVTSLLDVVAIIRHPPPPAVPNEYTLGKRTKMMKTKKSTLTEQQYSKEARPVRGATTHENRTATSPRMGATWRITLWRPVLCVPNGGARKAGMLESSGERCVGIGELLLGTIWHKRGPLGVKGILPLSVEP
ncbi:hypothetical protein EJB05_14181, partial [Eragrostis curvula]